MSVCFFVCLFADQIRCTAIHRDIVNELEQQAWIHRVRQKCGATDSSNTTNLKKITGRFLSKFAVKSIINIPSHLWVKKINRWIFGKVTIKSLLVSCSFFVFTARCYASAVLAMGLCLSVRLSVTSRSSTKTAKRRITQTTPHDSPGSLAFWSQRSPRNSTGVTPYGGTKRRWGGSKSATFDKLPAISRKRYTTDAWFLLKSNRKPYALSRMVTLPLTLSAP